MVPNLSAEQNHRVDWSHNAEPNRPVVARNPATANQLVDLNQPAVARTLSVAVSQHAEQNPLAAVNQAVDWRPAVVNCSVAKKVY